MKKMTIFIAAALALCILLCGCGSKADTADTIQSTPAPTPTPQVVYVEVTPAPTPTPVPTPTPEPTASPAVLENTAGTAATTVSLSANSGNTGTNVYVTKSPTSETVCPGGSAVFIAHAANASSVSWQMVNWDASIIYPLADAPRQLGCTVYGNGTDTVTLGNIPSCMNGWRIQAKFEGSGGPVFSDMAYVYVSSGCSSSGGQPWYIRSRPSCIPDYMKTWSYTYDPATGCIHYDESAMYPSGPVYPYQPYNPYWQMQQAFPYYQAIYGCGAIPVYF